MGDSDVDPAVGDPSGDGEGLDAGEGVGLGLGRGRGLALPEADAGGEDEPGVLDELEAGLEAVTLKLLDS